jgi:hypothetical protein
MDRWRERPVVRVTLVLLVSAFALIGFGALGLAASPVLVGLLLAGAVGLRALATAFEGTAADRIDDARLYADLWRGPALAVVLTLAWLDATPGELQSIGGLVGLVGMANYFLGPVYRFCYRLAQRAGVVTAASTE